MCTSHTHTDSFQGLSGWHVLGRLAGAGRAAGSSRSVKAEYQRSFLFLRLLPAWTGPTLPVWLMHGTFLASAEPLSTPGVPPAMLTWETDKGLEDRRDKEPGQETTAHAATYSWTASCASGWPPEISTEMRLPLELDPGRALAVPPPLLAFRADPGSISLYTPNNCDPGRAGSELSACRAGCDYHTVQLPRSKLRGQTPSWAPNFAPQTQPATDSGP